MKKHLLFSILLTLATYSHSSHSSLESINLATIGMCASNFNPKISESIILALLGQNKITVELDKTFDEQLKRQKFAKELHARKKDKQFNNPKASFKSHRTFRKDMPHTKR